jgi:hypothetical protein
MMTEKLSVQRLDTLRGDLLRKNKGGIGWRDLAANFPGVPPSTLCAFAHGREPKKASVRAALGLPVLALALVCPRCGVVHLRQCRAVPRWVRIAAAWLGERERG